MMRVLLPVVMLLFGAGAGIGVGLWLAPQGAKDEAAAGAEAAPHEAAPTHDSTQQTQTEFVRLNNQFVVPVVARERIAAMVVMSLSIEVRAGAAQSVYTLEPKLRDGFLQVLFDHANRGGFDGAFTEANTMDVLRRMLFEVGRDLLGEEAQEVLITEIARQDV